MSGEFFCFLISAIIFVLGFLVFLIWLVYSLGNADKPAHNPHHKGITVDTMFGKKDVICPKCKCARCQYVYDTVQISNAKCVTKTKYHPFNIFKPYVEEVTTVKPGTTARVVKYRCEKCGYIFQ